LDIGLVTDRSKTFHQNTGKIYNGRKKKLGAFR
jgi:hypothetical protein